MAAVAAAGEMAAGMGAATGAIGAAGTGAGAGAGAIIGATCARGAATVAAIRGACATAGAAMATVPPSPSAGPTGFAGWAAAAERIPWGGVCGEKGLGAGPLGSSAPQPKQNL